MKLNLLLYFNINLFIISVSSWRFFPHNSNKKLIKSIDNKKYISITPGGVAGFYTLGICSFIKKNYNLSNYHFIGASAGAWNSLLMSYNYDIDSILNNLFDTHELDNITSISNLQYKLREYLLNNYNSSDFDLNKLNICISSLDRFMFVSNIANNFTNLEQVLDCCIVSSHIPYITSDNLIKKYNNIVSFDGGLVKFPPSNIYSHIIIKPEMYNSDFFGNLLINILDYSENTSTFIDLYEKGKMDALNDKENLDIIFKTNYINKVNNTIDLFYI